MVLDFEKMTRAEAVQVINDLSKKEIKNWLIYNDRNGDYTSEFISKKDLAEMMLNQVETL